MTMTRLGSPTWTAASPMPGAAYMVSSMSVMRARRASSTAATGSDLVFRTDRSALLSTVRMRRRAMTSVR